MVSPAPRVYEVVPATFWKNVSNGRRASIFDSAPWTPDTVKQWKLVTEGYIVRDSRTKKIASSEISDTMENCRMLVQRLNMMTS